MPKKEQRISINEFERVAEERFPTTVTEQWFDSEIIIKQCLSVKETCEVVNEIIGMVFSDNGDYMPEFYDFAVRSTVLTHFANFTLPQNIEKRYSLIFNTDAYHFVLKHINRSEFEGIIRAANARIDYLRESNVYALRSEINELLGRTNDVIKAYEDMNTNMVKLFEGINIDSVKDLFGSLGESGLFEPSKFVDTYLGRLKEDRDAAEVMRSGYIATIDNPDAFPETISICTTATEDDKN